MLPFGPENPGLTSLSLAEQLMRLEPPGGGASGPRGFAPGGAAPRTGAGTPLPGRDGSGARRSGVWKLLEPVYAEVRDRYELLRTLGEAYFHLARYEEAEELLARAIQIRNPDGPQPEPAGGWRASRSPTFRGPERRSSGRCPSTGTRNRSAMLSPASRQPNAASSPDRNADSHGTRRRARDSRAAPTRGTPPGGPGPQVRFAWPALPSPRFLVAARMVNPRRVAAWNRFSADSGEVRYLRGRTSETR